MFGHPPAPFQTGPSCSKFSPTLQDPHPESWTPRLDPTADRALSLEAHHSVPSHAVTWAASPPGSHCAAQPAPPPPPSPPASLGPGPRSLCHLSSPCCTSSSLNVQPDLPPPLRVPLALLPALSAPPASRSPLAALCPGRPSRGHITWSLGATSPPGLKVQPPPRHSLLPALFRTQHLEPTSCDCNSSVLCRLRWPECRPSGQRLGVVPTLSPARVGVYSHTGDKTLSVLYLGLGSPMVHCPALVPSRVSSSGSLL